jgi:hypothetical protein
MWLLIKRILLKYCDVVDLSISIQPFESLIEITKGSSPICSIFKLISYHRESLTVYLQELFLGNIVLIDLLDSLLCLLMDVLQSCLFLKEGLARLCKFRFFKMGYGKWLLSCKIKVIWFMVFVKCCLPIQMLACQGTFPSKSVLSVKIRISLPYFSMMIILSIYLNLGMIFTKVW